MIYCPNCGSGLQNDAAFCPECGVQIEKIESSQQVATTGNQIAPQTNIVTGTIQPAQSQQAGATSEVKPVSTPGQFQHFLKISLPDLTKKILFDPLDGTKKILTEIQEPLKIGLYCIFICSFLISILVYIRIPSALRRDFDFFEYFFRAFSLPVIGAFIITLFSFIIKAINNSQKANFSNEILTGGIVSIGYAVFFVVAFLLSYIIEGSFNNTNRYYDGYSSFPSRRGPPVFLYIIIFSTLIYLFVITANSLSQSLRSSGVKDAVAFYLSPFLIILSAYLTIRLWIALFGAKYGLGFENIFDIF